MRSDVQYLIDISTPSKEFDAIYFVENCIFSEVAQLRHASIFSSFHGHVTRHGYPVAEENIKNSSYVNRKKLEKLVDESIRSASNLFLIGCEGSGKTTLLHYIISVNYKNYNSIFCYVDVSDVGSSIQSFSEMFYEKIRNSLFLALSSDLKQNFKKWIEKFRDDPFANDLVNTKTTKNFVESIMIYLNSESEFSSVYFIIDNIDSLKSRTVEDFFSALHALEETVASAFSTLEIKNFDKVRFVVCCRTQSIDIVTSASQGLFTSSPYLTIDMDERFTADTDIIELTRRFVKMEKDYIFRGNQLKTTRVRVDANFGAVGWESFDEYFDDVFNWMARSKDEVNDTISRFCGRSIRRSKLFLVKSLASPVIARLAFFEKHNIYNITRNDPNYLGRRMLEALFDFTTSSALQMPGYPLNPFRVLRDNRNFKHNPLIGVVALLYIYENIEILRMNDIHYAQAIIVDPLVTYLVKVRYERDAIVECINYFVLSGLIRPIIGAKIIMEEEANGDIVYDSYIIDHYALKAYSDLILFKKWKSSLTFYNGALRARYKIRGDHHLDNMAYEVYTFLVFLFDLLEREQKLEGQFQGTGIMFKPLSARIRHTVFTVIPNEIEKASAVISSRAPGDRLRREQQADLVQKTKEMLEEARWKLSRQAGII